MTTHVTASVVICMMGATIAGIALARPGPTQLVPAPITHPISATAGIVIEQFVFAGNMTVAPGETVLVSNVDGVQHTLTSSDGLFDTGLLEAAGGAGSFVVPTAPGTYAFFCSVHPSMTGTITVVAG